MRLYLMRHAEAGWDAVSDAERALTPAGIVCVRRLLASDTGVLSDIKAIVSSPYRRARQTAALVSEQLAVPVLDPDPAFVPETSVIAALSQLEQLPWAGLLLVAHQPLLGELIATLAGDTRYPEPMAPGSIAVLETDWPAAGLAQLVAKLDC
jgi:phosphohistidine phosphatase